MNSAGAEVTGAVALPPLGALGVLGGRAPVGAEGTGTEGAGAVSMMRPVVEYGGGETTEVNVAGGAPAPPPTGDDAGGAAAGLLPTPPRTGEDAGAEGT